MAYLIILIPFALLILLNLLPARSRTPIAFYATLVLLAGQVLLSPFELVRSASFEAMLGFNLLLNNFSLILIITSGIVALASLLTAGAMIKEDGKRFNFINLLLILLIAMNGLAMAKDIFTLYVFIEAAAVATFILIALNKDKYAFEGILKYLILSVVASVLMLSAIGLLIMSSGSLLLADIRGFIFPSGGTVFSQAAMRAASVL